MKRYLVAYRHPPGTAMRPAVAAHLHALEQALERRGGGRVVYHNAYDESPPAWLRALEFDGVVLHTTFLCMRWSDHFGLFSWRYRWLADLPCVKLAIPQDEYDHSEILDEWLHALGVTDVFTNFYAERRALIYPLLHDSEVRFHEVLTGYIDETMARRAAGLARPPAERPVDIVYRASRLPYWFGSHGRFKHRIADVVDARARRRGLSTDISTSYDDVLYGDAWTDFLLSGRTVLGVESGSSVLDRRGEIQAAVGVLLRQDPSATFEQVSASLPRGWDDHDFGAVSPRHFEAVVARTCQILTDGAYSGVLEPGRHYLALRRDFSNLDEVLEQIRDDAVLARIADTAYEEIYVSGRYTYAVFGDRLAAALDDRLSPRGLRRSAAPLLSTAGPRLEGAAAAARHHVAPYVRPALRALAGTAAADTDGAGATPPVARLRAYAAAGRLVVSALADPGVRGLVGRYLRGGDWRRLPARSLVGDLVRVGIARRTTPLTELRVDDARALVWDHAAVGTVAPLGASGPEAGVVDLSPTGRYELRALGELARLYPSAAERIGEGGRAT